MFCHTGDFWRVKYRENFLPVSLRPAPSFYESFVNLIQPNIKRMAAYMIKTSKKGLSNLYIPYRSQTCLTSKTQSGMTPLILIT